MYFFFQIKTRALYLELFSDDDVSGKTLYGFQTPSKKNAMAQKANLCCTPLSSRKEKSHKDLKVVIERISLSQGELSKTDGKNFPARGIMIPLLLLKRFIAVITTA